MNGCKIDPNPGTRLGEGQPFESQASTATQPQAPILQHPRGPSLPSSTCTAGGASGIFFLHCADRKGKADQTTA